MLNLAEPDETRLEFNDSVTDVDFFRAKLFGLFSFFVLLLIDLWIGRISSGSARLAVLFWAKLREREWEILDLVEREYPLN